VPGPMNLGVGTGARVLRHSRDRRRGPLPVNHRFFMLRGALVALAGARKRPAGPQVGCSAAVAATACSFCVLPAPSTAGSPSCVASARAERVTLGALHGK